MAMAGSIPGLSQLNAIPSTARVVAWGAGGTSSRDADDMRAW